MLRKTNSAAMDEETTFEPTKRDVKKAKNAIVSQIRRNLADYADLAEALLRKADLIEELEEKLKMNPKSRLTAKKAEQAKLAYQRIGDLLTEKEAALDTDIGELARSYYSLSEFYGNENAKSKVYETGKTMVQDFENAKAEIEGRVKDLKLLGNLEYYDAHKDEDPDVAVDEGKTVGATNKEFDLEDEEMDNQRIENLEEQLKNLTYAINNMKAEKPQDPGMPPYGYYPPERPAYRVAPVTIDISREISKAVESALEKFSDAFERKINEYVSEMPSFVNNTGFDISETVNEALQAMAENVDAKIALINEKIDSVAASSNGANMEAFGHAYQLAEQVSDDENFIMGKLTEMLGNVKTLNDKMLELSATHMEIAEKQKEIVDLQRQTNDMQRYTLREQEGVQVNQRVIGKDQVAIAERQAVINEEQKNVANVQNEIVESQKVTAVDQKTVLDVQTSIEDAMKGILAEQENMNNNQREILKGSAQNYDIQQEIASLQVEITNAQKDVMNSQKQMFRDQKAVNEKQKANGDLQAEINEDLKTLAKNSKAIADSLAKTLGKKAKKDAAPTENQ